MFVRDPASGAMCVTVFCIDEDLLLTETKQVFSNGHSSRHIGTLLCLLGGVRWAATGKAPCPEVSVMG